MVSIVLNRFFGYNGLTSGLGIVHGMVASYLLEVLAKYILHLFHSLRLGHLERGLLIGLTPAIRPFIVDSLRFLLKSNIFLLTRVMDLQINVSESSQEPLTHS